MIKLVAILKTIYRYQIALERCISGLTNNFAETIESEI